MTHLQELAASSLSMLKTDEEIRTLNKHHAQTYSQKLTNGYKKLLDALFDKEKGIIVKMQMQIEEQQKVNAMLLAKMEILEKNQIETDQYSRKETIEVRGIDEDLPNDQVEKQVVDMLNSIKDDDEPAFTK